MDRQEIGSSNMSASQELKKDYGIDVFSLINISDIIDYVTNTKEFENFRDDIIEYKKKYSL